MHPNQSSRRSLETELDIAVKSGELKLQCNNLSDFPRSLGKHFVLTDTRIADLSRNKLVELPVDCTYFPSLEKLILYHNIIKSIPDSISSLQTLQYLDLSRNQLSFIPHAVCQLSQLQSLVLNNNKLVSLPEEIGELTNLMQLDVSCNEIAHLPVQIGDLSNLRTLSLRRNHLQEVPVELTYLQLSTLDLSSNRLSNLPVELRFMITLVELNLEENPLSCPPANMCCRGRVHIFKYLETIAIKEDKKRGILADTEHRRSYRKTSQIGDMRFGAVSADARLKRHTADSGYGSEQPNARRWSTELQDGPDHHAEDARRLAHRAISYRPAVNSQGFGSSNGPTSPTSLSPKPSLSVQISHPSLASNGSGSSGVSSLSSMGATLDSSVDNSKDVCDNPKWNQPSQLKPSEPVIPARNSFVASEPMVQVSNGRTNGKIEKRVFNGANPFQPNGTKNIIAKGPAIHRNRDLSLTNLDRKPVNGNGTDADQAKKSILKSSRTNSNSSLPGKLPVPNQTLSPRHSPTSPTSPVSSGLPSPNSIKSFGSYHSNPNSSGLPNPTAFSSQQNKTSNFQTYRQYKEQQKLSRQTDSVYKTEQKSYTSHSNVQKTGVEIRSYYERMQTTTTPRAGAPPETSPPPPPSLSKSPVSRTAIPTANRSPSSVSTGSYSRAPAPARVKEKSLFTVKRDSDRSAVQDMHIHHLRQNIEQRLKISLGDDLPACLTDGVVLCHMANHVAPRSVNSIHVPSPAVPKLSAAKCQRNVDNFLSACRRIGVREDLICGISDIMEPNKSHTCDEHVETLKYYLYNAYSRRMDNMRTPRDGENSETFLCRVREFFHPTPSEIRIKQETRELVDFAVYFSLRTNFSGSSTRTESCLRRCISRMHEKHSMVFGGMMTRLNINRNIDFYQGFIEVSEELFREEISWSKIVALYAFGARLAQFCAENDMEDLLRDISESLARFSDEHLAAYILAQGGWETLCDEYPPEDELETRVWKSLGILALCLTSASVFLVLRR